MVMDQVKTKIGSKNAHAEPNSFHGVGSTVGLCRKNILDGVGLTCYQVLGQNGGCCEISVLDSVMWHGVGPTDLWWLTNLQHDV